MKIDFKTQKNQTDIVSVYRDDGRVIEKIRFTHEMRINRQQVYIGSANQVFGIQFKQDSQLGPTRVYVLYLCVELARTS